MTSGLTNKEKRMLTDKHFEIAKKAQIKRVKEIAKHFETYEASVSQKRIINLTTKSKTLENIEHLSLKKEKGVYLVFVPANKVDKLKNNLNEFREKQKKHVKKEALPRPNKDNKTKDGCLYVGMISKGTLKRRFTEHFIGTKSHKTGALKLPLWAKELKEVTVQYIVFEEKDHPFIEEYEKALWHYFEPAVGEL